MFLDSLDSDQQTFVAFPMKVLGNKLKASRSRLLRGVGGRHGQFRERGVSESGAAMAAGESMAQRMVWVDLEMTGLDIEKDQIIEMACLITDSDLNILAEGPNLIIKQPDELMDSMSDWCKEHHGKSGLTKAVKESTTTLQQAEYEFLSFVRQQTPPGLCPLAGNSVHADKKFLDKYMPQFMKHLHYRIIDVSTVKELCRRWYPEDYEFAPKKAASHRVLDDISESIKELQFYRNNIFKKKTDEKKRKIIENGENEKTLTFHLQTPQADKTSLFVSSNLLFPL
ncbi:oligoribonuclease, mitochondrial isoform X2 [Cricetulus griseus]|uniref:Oligoribonuclease, mitochondrial n=1 Tax=Cricetulus griseus TaxID=10029 RepID=A0A9J7GGM6_CRIGR|nr:oligoribonuclease, mitochondrial isoform X2 [Cricetulus griseus]